MQSICLFFFNGQNEVFGSKLCINRKILTRSVYAIYGLFGESGLKDSEKQRAKTARLPNYVQPKPNVKSTRKICLVVLLFIT